MNDSNSKCFAIRLTGSDTGAGKGKHKIKLKYDHLNDSAENGCAGGSITKPTVEISIEWKDKLVLLIWEFLQL